MMDGARFRVERTVADASRPHFLLVGTLGEGEIRLGMVVTAGPAHRPSFRDAIDVIEAVRDEGGERIALGFRWMHAAERERWSEMDWKDVELVIPAAPVLHPCPCCGFRELTEAERGGYEICGSCGWEDDPVQFRDPGYRGGANSESLDEARAAFRARRPHLFEADG